MSETATPVVLTLGAKSILTSPSDIISYQLNNYICVPKSYNNTAFDMIVSLADTISQYSLNKQALADKVSQDLNSVFGRLFPNNTVNVNVYTQDNNNATYSLVVGVSVTVNGTIYSTSPSVTVKNGILQLDNNVVVTVAVNSLDLNS